MQILLFQIANNKSRDILQSLIKDLNFYDSLLNLSKDEIVVNVQGDEPFINPENIKIAINNYIERKKVDNKMVCSTLHYETTDINAIKSHSRGKMVMDLNGNINFNIGDCLVFTGERGCGKSTLSKYIAGFLYKDDDKVNYRENVIYIEQDLGDKWKNTKLRWKDCFENKSIDEIKAILSIFACPVDRIFKNESKLDLGLPSDAVVVGRYGGKDTFDLDFVKDAVIESLEKRSNLYYLFLNTPKFIENDRCLFFDKIISIFQ